MKPLYLQIKNNFLKDIRKENKNAFTIFYQIRNENSFQKILSTITSKEF